MLIKTSKVVPDLCNPTFTPFGMGKKSSVKMHLKPFWKLLILEKRYPVTDNWFWQENKKVTKNSLKTHFAVTMSLKNEIK